MTKTAIYPNQADTRDKHASSWAELTGERADSN